MSDDTHDSDSDRSDEKAESSWYFSRRGMLEGAGITGSLVVGGAIGYDLAALGEKRPDGEAPSPDEMLTEPTPTAEEAGAGAFGFFNLDQARTVEALAERIYPATDRGPGATEAGVVFFLDTRLQGPWGSGEKWYMEGPFRPEEAVPNQGWQYGLVPREVYTQSLTALREYVGQEYNSMFFELNNEQQRTVISALQNENIPTFGTPTSNDFFEMLRSGVLEGMFSDPAYGGNRNMVGWKLKEFPGTPGSLGSYRARIEEDQFIHLSPTALEGQNLGPDLKPTYPEEAGDGDGGTAPPDQTDSANRTDTTNRTDNTTQGGSE